MSSVTKQNDWEIIGYVSSGGVGCIVITFLLIDLLRNFRNNKGHNSQKYLSIISLSNALLLCFMVTFIRTNIFVHDLDHTPNGLPCKISYALSGIFYIVNKFAMYILFTFRIEIVFNKSIYAVSHTFLTIMRCIIVILGIIFCITQNFPDREQVATETYNISYCTAKKGQLNQINFGSIMIISFVITDLCLLLWLLWLFNSKLYKMTKLMSNPSISEENDQTIDFIRQTESLLIKSTILVSTSLISTLLFFFIGMFIWKPIGWFIPLDMTFNALSIYLMYSFSRKTYFFCCWPCIKCCSLLIKDEIFWNSSTGKQTISSSSTGIKSIHVKEEDFRDDEDVTADQCVLHTTGHSISSLRFEEQSIQLTNNISNRNSNQLDRIKENEMI